MKWMKKGIMITLTLLLLTCLSGEASAVTTGKWDLGKARESIGNAAAQILQQETEPESAEAAATEPAASGFDWSEWTRCWFRWLEGWQ